MSIDSLPAERQADILDQLRREGRVLAADLVREFATSEDTIRRDLRDLAARGLCRRVYGGALAISPASADAKTRAEEVPVRKRALGRALAALVRPGQFLFIDAGSTNLAAARALPEDLRATVATHDPAIAAALVGRLHLELLLVGGKVSHHAGAALGGAALRTIADLRPDLLLLGACAIDDGAGITAFDPEDADAKRMLVENAGSVASAVLNEKLGTTARFGIGPLSALADLVVEANAPSEALAIVAAGIIRIHRAEPTQED